MTGRLEKNTHLCSTRVWTEYCAKTTLSWRIPAHKYQLYNPNVSVCSQLLLNTKCQPSCQLHLTAVCQLRYTNLLTGVTKKNIFLTTELWRD